MGYLRRRSPCTTSRVAAPLAQCEPRLIGLSQPGSWPTHTPFSTSAMTVQPTEQCVQMFLRSTAWDGAVPAACALRTPVRESPPKAERAPAASPERRRKERRSTTPPHWVASVAARAPRRAWRSLFLMSTGLASPQLGYLFTR